MGRRRENRRPLPRKPGWRDVPDDFWLLAEPLWPRRRCRSNRGRPRSEPRGVLNGILYVLRTGCQWKMVPREYGSGSMLHKYFQEWTKKGFFRRLWAAAAEKYDGIKGLDWEWQVIDSVTVQAPVKGGISQGKTPRTGRNSARSGITVSTPAEYLSGRCCRKRTATMSLWPRHS